MAAPSRLAESPATHRRHNRAIEPSKTPSHPEAVLAGTSACCRQALKTSAKQNPAEKNKTAHFLQSAGARARVRPFWQYQSTIVSREAVPSERTCRSRRKTQT